MTNRPRSQPETDYGCRSNYLFYFLFGKRTPNQSSPTETRGVQRNYHLPRLKAARRLEHNPGKNTKCMEYIFVTTGHQTLVRFTQLKHHNKFLALRGIKVAVAVYTLLWKMWGVCLCHGTEVSPHPHPLHNLFLASTHHVRNQNQQFRGKSGIESDVLRTRLPLSQTNTLHCESRSNPTSRSAKATECPLGCLIKPRVFN